MGKFVLGSVIAGTLLLGVLSPCWAEPPLPPPGVPAVVAPTYRGPVYSNPPPAAAPSAPVAPQGQVARPGGQYSVVSGDTLTAVAARHGVSLESLVAANPQIRDPNKIWPGDRVAIPTDGGVPTAARPPRPSSSTPGSTALSSGSYPLTGGSSDANDAARSLIGTKNPSDPRGSWGGWCLRLVNAAFQKAGRALRELNASCAKEAYDAFKREGLVQTGGTAPCGAIVFWSWVGTIDGVTKDWGHVALSNGDGTVISTSMASGGIDAAVPSSRFGTPLGWVLPPSNK